MRLNPLIQVAFPGLALTLACLLPVAIHSQAPQSITVNGTARGTITLDAPSGWELQVHQFDAKGNRLPESPSDFRRLGEATVGQLGDLHTLTLRFSQDTRITGISVTADFKVEQGGSCVEGNVYKKDATCRLLVRFTPQGPGNRIGKLTVSESASATPDAFGLGGFSYSPVVSFIPSSITTVPGTFPSSKGLLSGANKLVVDGGDIIYINDIGNSLLREIDSSGAITSVAPAFGTPNSIAVDNFGNVWAPLSSGGSFYFATINPTRTQTGWSGPSYTPGTCTANTPCNLTTVGLGNAAEIGIDSNDNLFMEEETRGAVEMPVGSWTDLTSTLNLWYLKDTYAYFLGPPSTFAVNANGDLFTAISYTYQSDCSIVDEPLYGAEGSNPSYTRVAGAIKCGYSGDGGLGANAEIGGKIGQMAFDAAGDLYFTDSNNQRVRRIEYNTGTIRTVAGDGIAGYVDSSSAIKAELYNPTGLSVDSQGQVYIISGTGTGSAQVVRKVGTTGYATMGNIVVGATSPPQVVLLTNTGNNPLVINNAVFGGTNPTEFSLDPGTTSCAFTAGSVLDAGQSCQIGFVLKPAGTGARRGTFTITDNTANFSNLINVSGTGILPSAIFAITSPTNNSSVVVGTSVTFKTSVTYGSSPAPTGTVQFKVDGTNYGSAVTISSGIASTTVTGLSVASHTLSATYSGDSHYAAGGPISVTITVTASIAHQPAVTMLPLAKASTPCMPLSFNVSVAGTSGMVPTGTVQLTDGGRAVSSAKLVKGKAILISPRLPAGTHSFTTQYGGDANNPPAASAALVEAIAQSGACNQHVNRFGMR
ncbi:MAG TPA: Ig-like domain repeat protein [Terracidiphilus sp.]|jgi:hypothetical protein|nr:Ig-like domain repeat protein [Terracidiphilus sp.]